MTPERFLRLELEFDGTDFEGWQRQRDARTVQGEVESSVEKVLGARHAVVASGRTDAGVHARGMIASMRTRATMPAAELERALDAVLPADIGLRSLVEAPAGFHAQRDAAWKWYRYHILVSRRKRPSLRRTTWRLPRVPDVDGLRAAANALEGTHDFRSFANTGSSPGDTTRTIFTLRWTREDDLLLLDVVGDGFLYKMVRTLVGTMLREAEADEPDRRIRDILSAGDRRSAGRAAPARGLCLMAVALRGEPTPIGVPHFLVPEVDSGSRRALGGSR